jgi:hypothetical protein
MKKRKSGRAAGTEEIGTSRQVCAGRCWMSPTVACTALLAAIEQPARDGEIPIAPAAPPSPTKSRVPSLEEADVGPAQGAHGDAPGQGRWEFFRVPVGIGYPGPSLK